MSDKIKSCFMDEQPDFYKEVELDGKRIATIKALSRNDYAEMERRSTKKVFNKDGSIELQVNSWTMRIVRMKCSLTDDDKVGWVWDREITEESIGVLDKATFDAIDIEIVKLENGYEENKEAISKNLKEQSS